MTSHAQAIAAAFAIVCLFGLGPSRAQQSIEEGAGDPSTAYGRSVIQNQQYQQQEQQNEQQNRQNQQDLQQRQQQFNQMNQSGQQQGYYQAPSPSGGVNGAIYVFPANPSISWITYNWRLPASARAAAKVGCYRSAGGRECILALDFHNACSAIAYGSNRVWAARAAGSVGAARAEAMAACHRAGGQSCVAVNGYCSPNNG